jgi:endonuclease/exonuclease/phosphatase family metal-dependent hydrolase
MKNISFVQKIILFFTWIFVFILVLGFITPYIPPKYFPQLSFIGLIFPYIVFINMLLLIYWLINLKKYFLLPLLALLLNYNNLHALFQSSGKHSIDNEGISIMSYNVRLFNAYRWIKEKAVDVDISNFIKDQAPDILLLQEFTDHQKTDFSQYKYKQIVLKGKKRPSGMAIFSKFPIVNKGSVNFEHSYNNSIWADLKIGRDTVRVYNVHMQSHRVHPEDIKEGDKMKLSEEISKDFVKQYNQALKIDKHLSQVHYPVILGGDFNNTAFSYIYKKLKGDRRQDAFVEAGKGFGFTWHYKYFPFRIDFLMIDKAFFVREFETMNRIKYSDHYPIKTLIKMK